MTTLKQRIADEMKAALLERHRFRGEVLRTLKASILNEEVAKQKREEGLDDSEVEAVLVHEAKKRTESSILYRQNGRDDLAEKEEKELEIIKEFLPEQLSEEEIQSVIDQKIADLGDVDMKAMGQVIGAVKQEVGSKADGAIVAKLVKETLLKR